MEEPSDFQDWELLYNSDTGLDVSSPDSADAFKGFGGVEGDTDGGIKSDYFALDSEKRRARTIASDEEGLPDSGNSGLVDPISESGCLGQLKGEPGVEELGFARDNSGGFLTSDEFYYGQTSLPDHRKGELGSRENLKSEAGMEGIEVGNENFGVILSDVGGNSKEDEREEVFLGETEDTVGLEAEGENPIESGSGPSGDPPKRRDGLETSEERVTGDANLGNLSAGEGDKTLMIWWKLPWELFKFYAFKVKPVWSISVAATLIGVVMLWRRLYTMKRKTRKLPLKISLEDKKVSQFMVQAARLNGAFQVVRRVPIIRPLPANGSTSWPVVALR